jgi:Tfp pilus assembly protein PilO
MNEQSSTALRNLQAEVEVLRELVQLLLSQLPSTDEKIRLLNDAQKSLSERYAPLSLERMAIDHAWNITAPHKRPYDKLE